MTTSKHQPLPVAGVILAGGLATRMGGGDKTLKTIGNKAILDTVINRIKPQVSNLALNTNHDPELYSHYDLPILPDHFEEKFGPLAGIHAGMEWAYKEGYSLVVTIAGDTPFFPQNLVSRLQEEQMKCKKCIVLAATKDKVTGRILRHPTFGLWSVELRGDLKVNLEQGVRKIVLWTDQHDAKLVEFPIQKVDPFFNINTPDDLKDASKLMKYVS